MGFVRKIRSDCKSRESRENHDNLWDKWGREDNYPRDACELCKRGSGTLPEREI